MTGLNSSRKVPIHDSACPRKSCKRFEQLTYILYSGLFLTASQDNLLASRSYPLGYLPSEDGESIQQEVTLNEAQKTLAICSSGLCVLSAVGKSETPSTLRSCTYIPVPPMIMKQMLPPTHRAHEQKSTSRA